MMRRPTSIALVLSLMVTPVTQASWLSDATGINIDLNNLATNGDANVRVGVPRPTIPNIPSPEEIFGSPLATGLRGAHGRLSGSAQPIPPAVRQWLAPYFDAATLDRVRWSTDIGAAQNFTLHQVVLGNGWANAITIDNIVVFDAAWRVNDTSYDGLKLWVHEIEHTQQYARMGIEGFAGRYTSNHWTLENGAIERSEQVMGAILQAARQQQQPSHGGYASAGSSNVCRAQYGWCYTNGWAVSGSGCSCWTGRGYDYGRMQ
jgi:hypothetical protein